MKKATSLVIPSDILEFILHSFYKNCKRQNRKRCNNFIYDLVKDINNFIETNSNNLPFLKSKFYNGITDDHLRRAFNVKTPNGATCEMRNALAYYATHGKMNWNRLIETRFQCHAALLDKHHDCKEQLSHNITLNELYEEVVMIKKLLLNH